MRSRSRAIRLIPLMFLTLALALAVLLPLVPATPVAAAAQGGQVAQGASASVHVVAVDGEITPAMASFLGNRVAEANQAGAAGILIEIKTFGGRVDSAVQMRDAIIGSRVPVAVYIETRAISAGALISIAAKKIVMAPGSHIGAAEPIPNNPKTLAYVSGEFRTTAERTGRDPQVAAAMVDASIEIPGLKSRGQILDLSATQALQYRIADHIADGRAAALQALGWGSAPLVETAPDFRNRIAQFLTSAEIASLLLTIAMLAIAVELFVPGFGLPGIIGIICFALYFFGGFAAGYTDQWAIVVFLIGMVLLIIELFVPGFGIFGIAGIVCMLIGVILAAPTAQQGVLSLLIAMAATAIAIPILFKIFGRTKLMRRLVLANEQTVDQGYVHAPALDRLIGCTGTALTVLRPAGKVLIDNNRIDAITNGEFIAAGTRVLVIQVVGTKVVVASAERD